MCIICNLGGTDDGLRAASRFLDAYQKARAAMKAATEAMAECSKINPRYDPAHKAMVRVMRDWNSLEHQREQTRDWRWEPNATTTKLSPPCWRRLPRSAKS